MMNYIEYMEGGNPIVRRDTVYENKDNGNKIEVIGFNPIELIKHGIKKINARLGKVEPSDDLGPNNQGYIRSRPNNLFYPRRIDNTDFRPIAYSFADLFTTGNKQKP